ncbi:MAG: zinc ribbon domain-containing protein [Nitrospinota bacterium]|nr:zinc ribbon domain-containing protein [Nitrospinota bacterium]
MPLFEYYCEECQREFTLLQSSNVNKEETTCETCGGSQVRYKFSTFAPKTQSVLVKKGPVTADELPNKNVLNLPLPRLRSEL